MKESKLTLHIEMPIEMSDIPSINVYDGDKLIATHDMIYAEDLYCAVIGRYNFYDDINKSKKQIADNTIKYLLYMLSKMWAYSCLGEDIEDRIILNRISNNKKIKNKYKKMLKNVKNKREELQTLYEKELCLFRLSKIERNDYTKDINNMPIEDYFIDNLSDMHTDVLYKEMYNEYLKEENNKWEY